jgi:signal transduction histidine kinase
MTVESVRGSGGEGEILDDLRATLALRKVDLVVTLGGPAAAFAQEHHADLFPAAPVLFAALDNRFLQSAPLASNETAVAVRNDPVRMIDTMLRLLPATRTVMVVIGASTVEQFWLEEVRRAVLPYEGRVRFIFTNRLTLAELLKRAGSLPPHSAIFYGIYSLDAAGIPQMEEPTLDAIHAAADAPMFGLHSHQLGHGIVGGPLLSLDQISHDTAEVALRLLRGEAPATIPARTMLAGAPIYDSRELRRWAIPEDRLSPDSTLAFREPPDWQRHQRLIIVASTFVGLQTAFAIGLTITLRRRRRAAASHDAWDVGAAEAALARLTHRLMQAHDEEGARIAATLHDDVCQQLTGLKMRLQSIGVDPGAGNAGLRRRIEELCDQFGALERRILALTDPIYARLDMLGLVGSARAFCQRLCQQRRIALEFEARDVPAKLCGAVTLAMFRVLQEAMDNALTHAATPRIAVSLSTRDGRLELQVEDNGRGFDPDQAIRQGAVGLIDMRERLRAVGGTCTFVSRPGAGTRIRASVPI